MNSPRMVVGYNSSDENDASVNILGARLQSGTTEPTVGSLNDGATGDLNVALVSRSLKDVKTACAICSNSRYFKSRKIKFDEPVRDMCDRCEFVKEVVEGCVAAGGFSRSATRGHEIRWEVHQERSVDDLRWCDLEFVNYRFEIFTLPGLPKPFSDFPVKTNGTTASAHTLEMVQEWLEMCQSSHKQCSLRGLPQVVLPKRLLDVSLPRVRLYETNIEFGRYACLSHCWGATRPACRTTSATLEANKTGIEWDALPATFQDAIDFTRQLGLRYIWIDSVCIIQEDATDWIEQSALMANIYENAYVTLCATASFSDDGGCYLPHPLHRSLRWISVAKRDGTNYEVCVRHQVEERHIPDWDRATRENMRRYFPLMTRAWAFQERLLSPRLIHFTAGEMMWECSELSTCECSRGKHSPFIRYNSRKKLHGEALSSTQLKRIEKYWNDIVFAFSGLYLSFSKDKFPALSGVAKQMLRLRRGDEYLAGLWRKTIIADLRWTIISGDGRRPSVWRSPSWSWASLDGVIHHKYYDRVARDYCDCIDASVTPSGADSTGELSSGYIVLAAPVILVKLEEATTYTYKEERFLLEQAGIKTKFVPDCDQDFENGLLVVGDSLLCVRLGNSQYNKDLCLVLKQRGGDINFPVHERVGYFTHETKELEEHWFPTGTKTTLVNII